MNGDAIGHRFVTVAKTCLMVLAWPVWMIVCAPLMADLCRSAFSPERLMAAAALALPTVVGMGAAVRATRSG